MQKSTIIFLLIALLPSVSAGFLAFGDTSISTEPCNIAVRNVTVQNTGQELATYSVSVDGEGSDYVTFSAINFVLQPGLYTAISTYYKTPCDTTTGTYPIKIYFTDGQDEQELAQELTVSMPENINITTKETTSVIEPCNTAAYTIELSNPANFTEIYTITAEGHPDVHVSEKQAVLKGGENKNIILSVTPEDCTQSGIYQLTAQFATEKSGQYKEQQLELIIKATDIPVLAEGISKIRTDYTDSTAELTIENTGDRTTTYSLSAEGISWATISPSTVSLNPGETKALALRLKPTSEVSTGEYPLIFTATVDQTGIKYTKEIAIKLQPPTFIEKNPAAVMAIAIILLAILAGAFFGIKYIRSPQFKEAYKQWKEKRKERAEKRRQIRAKLEAIRKEREQKRTELLNKRKEQQEKEQKRKEAEQERIKKQLQRKLEHDFKKEYHVVAKKDLVVGKSKKNILKILAVVIGIIILILLAAGWTIIAPNLQYVTLGLAILCVIFIAKKLSRTRIINAKWKNLLEKQTVSIKAWSDGLSHLGITAKQPIKNLKLLIKKTKPSTAPSPAIYQTFQIKTNTPDALTYKATFTISKRWLARKQAEELRLGRYNQDWTTIPLKKTGEDKKVVHYTAELNKTGTYCIYAKVKKQPIKPTSTARKLIYGILAIAIITGIAVIIAPQQSIVTHGIPPQSWKQDTVNKIDLSKYFSDPDGDKLNYTTTETKHITIEISGSTAYLTPESGWAGEERTRFIADDGKGGQIASNTVPLKVQKQLISIKYQPYIAIVISIITILLLLWIARSQKQK
ncbi:Uncharacterised protein [uncultured archaeon]|nr:Uncharacterised protein [uncultured archaeon]